jgi:uncharacterized SAM-binding protein YcdF (DUF218 family)
MLIFRHKPRMSWRRYQSRRYLRQIIVWTGLILLSYIPVRMAIATLRSPSPQAILTLGGASSREAFTAEFAQTHPNLPIWISSGLSKPTTEAVFQQAGVDLARLQQDQQATDTVTNFTTIIDKLQQNHVEHVYLITSDFHVPRASVIGTLILGSRGIRFTPISVPSSAPQEESPLRILRDIARSIVWILTGHTGAGLRSEETAYKLNNRIFGSNERHQP